MELTQYDRNIHLSPNELQELAYLAARPPRHGHWPKRCLEVLSRLRQPVVDALEVTGANLTVRSGVLKVLVRTMCELQSAYWGWSMETWSEILGPDGSSFQMRHQTQRGCRQHLVAVAYLLQLPLDVDALGPFHRLGLARKVFGRPRVDAAIREVAGTLAGWGYRETADGVSLHAALSEALLANRSPRLEELTVDGIDVLRQRAARQYLRDHLYVLARVLYGLGIVDRAPKKAFHANPDHDPTEGVAREWVGWSRRWLTTSTLSPKTRQAHYNLILKAGRWVTREHPERRIPSSGPVSWRHHTWQRWTG